MKKIKKVLLAIPVFFITLYSKVNAVIIPEEATWEIPPRDPSKYRIWYLIILVLMVILILGILRLMKDKPKKKKIAIAICIFLGICIYVVAVYFIEIYKPRVINA